MRKNIGLFGLILAASAMVVFSGCKSRSLDWDPDKTQQVPHAENDPGVVAAPLEAPTEVPTQPPVATEEPVVETQPEFLSDDNAA